MTTTSQTLHLGDTAIELQWHRTYLPGLHLIKLHDDEQTCRLAALRHIERFGGTLVEIINDQQRCITFSVDGDTYTLDPNRIYSPDGIAATLLEYSGRFTPEACSAAETFAQQLLAATGITTGEVPTPFLAIHNNTEGEYSIHSYINSAEAEALYINPTQCIDDFYYVTYRQAYDYLADQGQNCVLQHPRHVADDGSLSVWMERQGFPYINIEAMHSHVREQEHMLTLLREMILGKEQ